MKAYSFSMNASDWLASPAVKLMSKAERGVYIDLLCTAWESTKQGTLPASEDKIRRLAEMSPDEWAISSECILEKFPLSECGTFRYNPRLLKEANKQEAKREIASVAGQKSAEKRAADKAAKEAAEAALQRKPNENPTDVEINPTDVEESANGKPTISRVELSKEEKEKLASSAGQDEASPIESSDEPQRPTPRPKLYRYDNAPVFIATEFFDYLRKQGYGHVDMGMYLVRITEKIKNTLADPQQRKIKAEATNDEWKSFILNWLDADKRNKRLLMPDTAPVVSQTGYAAPNPALQITTTSTSYSREAIAARNVTKY